MSEAASSPGEAASLKRWLPLVETLTSVALAAWVGGIVALGAFAARIAFRDLPRGLAAPTMSTIFRSFDGVVVACVVVVAIGTGVRLVAVGLRGRADRIALVAGTALVILGALDVGYVHPAIERMFREGRTLEPAFAALHTLSSRSANLEALCALLVFAAHAWSHKRD
jgi:putative copper export protein